MNGLDVIIKNLRDTVKQTGLNAVVEPVYNGRSISINNDATCERLDEHTTIWIRLFPDNFTSQNAYVAQLATVQLPLSKRRRGIFTTLCRRLNRCKYISKVVITGVSTVEMNSFCRKYNFECVSPCDFVVPKRF